MKPSQHKSNSSDTLVMSERDFVIEMLNLGIKAVDKDGKPTTDPDKVELFVGVKLKTHAPLCYCKKCNDVFATKSKNGLCPACNSGGFTMTKTVKYSGINDLWKWSEDTERAIEDKEAKMIPFSYPRDKRSDSKGAQSRQVFVEWM